MTTFISDDHTQALLSPPDLRERVPDDDMVQCIIKAVERAGLFAFKVNRKGTGKAQDQPRMMPAQAETRQAADEEKQRAHQARNGRGRGPKPPHDTPPPDGQGNLTDPDSKLTRRSRRHEVRQTCNVQAVVDANASRLVVATDIGQTPSGRPMFAPTVPPDDAQATFQAQGRAAKPDRLLARLS